MPYAECAECSRPTGSSPGDCQTLHRVELKNRIAPMCCECLNNAVRKRNVKSKDSWKWQDGACACCKKRKTDKCSGMFQKKAFSSLCICGLSESDHLSDMYKAGFTSSTTVISSTNGADGSEDAPPLLTPRSNSRRQPRQNSGPQTPRQTDETKTVPTPSTESKGTAPVQTEQEQVYDDVDASEIGIQDIPSPDDAGFAIPTEQVISEPSEEQARLLETAQMLATQRDAAIIQIHQERGEYETLAEQYRALEDQMEATVQHVVKVMGEDKKRLQERVNALEEAHERLERERDEALASRDREICALRKHLDERNRLGKAARGNLVAILDDTQGESALSKANIEVARQQSARLEARIAAVRSYDPQVDELSAAMGAIEGRFAAAVHRTKVLKERLDVATDQQLGEAADNEALRQQQQIAGGRLRDALAERDLYKDRFEALSNKMRRAGSAIERLGASEAGAVGGSPQSELPGGVERQWSVQQGGIKVLRARPAGSGSNLLAMERGGSSGVDGTGGAERAAVQGTTEIPSEELSDWVKVAEGTFGVVFRANWLSAPVAVKRLRLGEVDSGEAAAQREEMIEDSQREVQRLVQLRHPNVLTFFGTVKERGGAALAIVTELMERDMRAWLHSDASHLDLAGRLVVARQAACGLSYLHAQQLVHRDVKPENFLLKEPNVVKICDFGLSRLKDASKVNTLRTAGTLLYIAPEVHRGETFDERSDVYSFAVLLWEVLTLRSPFGDKPLASIPGIVGWGKQHPSLGSLDEALAAAGATPTLGSALRDAVVAGWSHEAAARYDAREGVRRLDSALGALGVTGVADSARGALRGTWNGRDAPRVDLPGGGPATPQRLMADWIHFGEEPGSDI